MINARRTSPRPVPGPLLAALAAALMVMAPACLQVEVTVQMHENGWATITERVRFSKRLRELDGDKPPAKRLVRLLDKAAAEQRAKHLGKGAHLVSHKVSDLQDGGRESAAVYKIPDIEDLRLVNPYLHDAAPGRVMRLQFGPIYRRVHSFHRVGDLMMYLVPAERPTRRPPPKDAPPPPPPPTPADLQALRNLQPVFADLMKGVQLTVRLIATKPIALGAIRHRRSASKTITLLSFSDKDLDAHGRKFLENEELMLSILRFRMDAANIVSHTSGFPSNLTVPVARGRRPYASGRFRIRPTKALFKKYYAGRPKSQGGDMPDKRR